MEKPQIKDIKKHPLFARILDRQISKLFAKSPKHNGCDGKGGPDEHVEHVKDCLYCYHVDDAEKSKHFAITLIGLTMI